MSRCFPYPPPGYVCNRAAGDKALIESIEIEKEKEKLRKEKKEQKRREKELKKQEKKEKKKLKYIQKTDGGNKRKRDCDELDKKKVLDNDSVKKDNLQKNSEPEAEQLERSSLTEEYGQPIVTESLCYSSDGTQSKNKKSRIEQSPSNDSCTTQGKVIRFRLKRRDEGNGLPADDVPSTSGRTEYLGIKMFDVPPVKGSEDVIQRPAEQLAPNATSVKDDSKTLLSSPLKKVSRPKSVYEALFSELLPSIHFETMEVNDADYNWLLPGKKRVPQDKTSLKARDGLSGQQSVSLQPRAHLLPEVDLYVLPYTVPF